MKHLNKYVKLLPGDKRLKQLIKQHGDIWIVLRYKLNVRCLPGGGYYIMSKDESHERWVEEEFVHGVASVKGDKG